MLHKLHKNCSKKITGHFTKNLKRDFNFRFASSTLPSFCFWLNDLNYMYKKSVA